MQSYAQLLVICHPQEVPQLVRLHRELPRVELGAFDAACALCRPYAILQEATTCTGAHATEVHMCKTFKRASAPATGVRSAWLVTSTVTSIVRWCARRSRLLSAPLQPENCENVWRRMIASLETCGPVAPPQQPTHRSPVFSARRAQHRSYCAAVPK